MIQRNLLKPLRRLAALYPVVTVTGPRQSGKTTLCRAAFPEKPYVSLEPFDVRQYAQEDPRGFLAEHAEGAVIDEVQRAPDLLSYLQADVDERPDAGRFVLTGSQHLGLTSAVSQSLAGRTGILYLLPPSWDELQRFDTLPTELFEALWSGSFPRIYDRHIPPQQWLADYVSTYVQRDVRQVLNVGDLQVFTTFLRLCAGRTAQEINLSALGADAGVSHNTARSWLSVLEASFVCFQLAAWHRNVKKQLIKRAKLHFFDSGLVCYLLGIREPQQLRHHPQRGAIFETWVAAEIYKARVHRGIEPSLYYFRDAKGLEVDLIVERGETVTLVEAKSAATVAPQFFGNLERLADLIGDRAKHLSVESRVVFGGEEGQRRSRVQVVPWRGIAGQRWD